MRRVAIGRRVAYAQSDVGEVPASPRAATAVELKAQIEAERQGSPFLLFRDGAGRHQIFVLDATDERIALGRRASATLPLTWDDEVSRLHAELRRIGDEWTLLDDGLSLNGSFVNGELVRGHRRLHDGDALRLGGTVLVFRNPAEAESIATAPAADLRQAVSLSDSQRRVLIALCRPFKTSTAFVTPATNEQIAGELYLSVDAVKKHMRSLFEKFGIAHLPQNEKRARLVERAFAAGFVSERDL
jgi:pSer/pThr/pTyr-binding forkhead associated (FHA) protein